MFLTIVKRFKIKIIYDILYNICVNLNYIKNDNMKNNTKQFYINDNFYYFTKNNDGYDFCNTMNFNYLIIIHIHNEIKNVFHNKITKNKNNKINLIQKKGDIEKKKTRQKNYQLLN